MFASLPLNVASFILSAWDQEKHNSIFLHIVVVCIQDRHSLNSYLTIIYNIFYAVMCCLSPVFHFIMISPVHDNAGKNQNRPINDSPVRTCDSMFTLNFVCFYTCSLTYSVQTFPISLLHKEATRTFSAKASRVGRCCDDRDDVNPRGCMYEQINLSDAVQCFIDEFFCMSIEAMFDSRF